MKLRAVLIGLWSLVDISSGQYQHMMQLQHQVLQRNNPGNLVRPRPQMLLNRQRWPVATNQIPIVAQRPYKPLFTYMKGPPQLYRGQKLGVKTTSYPNYWKSPTFRPPVVKDMFRNPIPVINGLQTSTPTSAQKLLAASSPMQNLISNPSLSPNLLSGPLTKNYLAGPVSANNFQSAQLVQTSRPLVAPATAAPPPVMYPIRVDGDGGPIHTIPAPNLSLADKPIVVPDYQNYVEDHANRIKSGHTYEVTEDTHDHKQYPQSQTQNNLYFTETDSFSGSKLSPSNYYASVSQKSLLPQASALVAQPVAPALTSEELFTLLNDGVPQQQLSDTYSYPMLQQPQLQQHYLHQSYDNMKPIQPFKAVIQQSSGADSVQNILFRQDPKYIEKVQEQLLRQSITQPQFQSFNYQEPVQNYQNRPDSEKLRSEIEKAIGDSIDMNSLHYNVVRSTKESIPQNNNYNSKQNNSRHIIQDSESSASFNVEAKTSFMSPSSRNHNENSMSDISAVASTYLAEIDNIASSSIPPEYYASLSNKDTDNALATLQAAGNLINLAQNEKNFKAIPENYFADMSQYFSENSEADNSEYESEFKPMQMGNDKKNQAPIRIFVPEDYEDMNDQHTENIKVSASMNSEEMPKNDMTIVFENDDTDDSILQQYDDITQIGSQNNNSLSNIEVMLKEHMAPVESKKKADDVVVTVPKNVTNPTLDILTKDWKTSIIIKPKTSKTGENSEFNKLSEFGNRIRPKRN